MKCGVNMRGDMNADRCSMFLINIHSTPFPKGHVSELYPFHAFTAETLRDAKENPNKKILSYFDVISVII